MSTVRATLIRALLFCFGALATRASDLNSVIHTIASPPFSDSFPWQRVPTMCQTHLGGIFSRHNMTGTGRFDDQVARFLAENYNLIVANGLEPGKPGQCQEEAIRDLADRIHSFNPNAKVLMYQANQLTHSRQPNLLPPGHTVESLLPCGLENVKREWLVTKDDGTLHVSKPGKAGFYIHNLSNPEMRAQWIAVVTNSTLGDHIAGVFADNSMDQVPNYEGVSAERNSALLVGQQKLLSEIVAAGKYVIFNGLRYSVNKNTGIPNDDYDAIENLLPFASSGYFEPWLSGRYRNATTGKIDAAVVTHAMLRMINASTTQPDKGMTFKAGPGPCVGYIAGQDFGCTWPFANHSTPPLPNQMNGTPQTAEERRAAAAKYIGFPLATFLCAAGPKWHLDYAWGYTVNDFVPGSNTTHTLAGQPLLESNTPGSWYPELLNAPGTPLNTCTFDATTQTFSREWSGVSVSLNVVDETAVLKWKDESQFQK
eukprot:m.98092 g.98092  ORF g.98092 m.98092 type:complete len:483 (-) comp27034_c0_seq6:112-1560(-)